MGAGDDMTFLYWDDLGDSQDHVDKQEKEFEEKEFFEYFKYHPNSADNFPWDDGEEQDIE